MREGKGVPVCLVADVLDDFVGAWNVVGRPDILAEEVKRGCGQIDVRGKHSLAGIAPTPFDMQYVGLIVALGERRQDVHI